MLSAKATPLHATPWHARQAAMLHHYSSLYDGAEPRWHDYRFAYRFPQFLAASPQIPKFRIRSELLGDSGKVPPRAVARFGPLIIHGESAPDLAPSGVARNAFTIQADTWYFVEIAPDQFDDVASP